MFFAVYFHINVLLSYTHCLNSPRYICGDVSFFKAQIWFLLLNKRSNQSKFAGLNVINQMKFSGVPRPHVNG